MIGNEVRTRRALGCVFLLTLGACSVDDPTLGLPGVGSGSRDSGMSGDVVDASADGSSTPPRRDGSAFPSSDGGRPVGGVTDEVCDGTDSNGDGIVDNLDRDEDGICDCLRIATIGIAGTWGNGNIFGAWLQERSDNGATHLGDAVLTPELLEGFQVIVVQNVSAIGRSYSPAEVTAVHDWIRLRGGGLLTLTGFVGNATENDNVNRLLAPMDMRYGTTGILPKPIFGSTVPVNGWIAHTTTDGIERVGVDNGFEALGSGVVVSTEGGYTLGLAQEVGQGNVFVWGDEWITYDSEWTDHPDYQVQRFWLNIIKWLTPERECQVKIPDVIVI